MVKNTYSSSERQFRNYSLESDLSPKTLESELKDADTREFLDSYAGRKALAVLLYGLYDTIAHNNKYYRIQRLNLKDDPESADKLAYINQAASEQKSLKNNLLTLAHDLLEVDYDGVPLPEEQCGVKLILFWDEANHGKKVPADALKRANLFQENNQNESFWQSLKKKFRDFVSDWRGYTKDEINYGKSDIAFRKMLAQELKSPITSAQAFSNNGVKNMKVKRTVRKTFSNDVACDMLANKLTKDWFICEPECQPLIAEQLKAACVPAATFAPALKCNVLQYDGEAKVSAKELAALDKVQMFVQALKNEIACGNDCGGIKMVPDAKAFSLKRQLKRQLKNFDAEGEIDIEEVNTPAELIEAEAAGIDVDHPEMYEEFVDKVEAGQVSPEAMGLAPAVTAPTSVDPASMGHAYDDLVDSTIADNGGIMQEDMSGYDAAPGDLSLSAAPVGDAMAQAQADAIIWDDADEAAPMKAVAPVAPMANPQAFSRTLRRRQAGATAKNFANVRKPVQKKVQPQAAQSMKGLYRLLGDKYIK